MHDINRHYSSESSTLLTTDCVLVSSQADRPYPVNGNSKLPIRAMLILSTLLDCESLSALLSQRGGMEVLEASADLEYGLARCRRLSPNVLILDPKIGEEAIGQSCALMRTGFVKHVIVLDDRIHEGLVTRLLPLPGISYMTRRAGVVALHAAMTRITRGTQRVFDPEIEPRVLRSSRGFRLEQPGDHPSVAALTTRELEVMQHLAKGRSVRDCAKQMNLAESTIDNHKSRLMKKLKIHKAAQLTQVAIREGVISL